MTQLPISILISIYHKERPLFLRQALESLVKQTHPVAQVVLVFDGPISDALEAVVQVFYATLPLCIVRLPENQGLAKALNAGLPYCTQDWVARFDTDDICEPDRFERQWTYLQSHPEVDVLGGSILEFDRDPTIPYALRKLPSAHADILIWARKRSPFNHMTVIFRKSAVLDAGGYPDDHLYEDYALWVKLIQQGCQFANLEQPLVRARAGAEMVNRRGGWKYFCSELRVHFRFMRAGFISLPRFLLNVILRGTVRMAPAGLRIWIYTSIIRHRIR